MKVARYHHTMVYDNKRGRIYVFGGIGENSINNDDMSLEFDKDNETNQYFLKDCEYYDVKNDTWI